MSDKQQTGTGRRVDPSPTPWSRACFQVYDKNRRPVAHTGGMGRTPSEATQSEENAEFIVQCVNTHSDMKAALEKCQKTLALLIDPKANRNISGAGVINAFAICTKAEATARAALSKLTGGGE